MLEVNIALHLYLVRIQPNKLRRIVMALGDYGLSVDGIEMQFASNHVGHFLFTNLLMDKIFAAGKSGRIINVSSGGHVCSGVRFTDWNFRVRYPINVSKG